MTDCPGFYEQNSRDPEVPDPELSGSEGYDGSETEEEEEE